jgi:hypothetical protein
MQEAYPDGSPHRNRQGDPKPAAGEMAAAWRTKSTTRANERDVATWRFRRAASETREIADSA